GYQRELTYRHNDGSFSAFGVSDRNGSIWLTAFVLKSFLQAKAFITIDEQIVDRSVEFLLYKQNRDGYFVEDGHVFSKSMQGGVADGKASLTAYVLIALSFDYDLRENLSKTGKLEKTIELLAKRLEKSDDVYEIVLIAYALHLNEDRMKNLSFEKLRKLATVKQDFTFWRTKNLNEFDSNAVEIEITSYALLTFMLRNETENAISIVRWLIARQNCKGGFHSTQDTVIALQALASFAEKVNSENINLNVLLTTNLGETKSLRVNKSNSIALQEVIFDRSTRLITIAANGFGTAIIQISVQYNVLRARKVDFNLKFNFVSKTDSTIKFNVCVNA
ncbi:thioester-containing protein-like protein, partial [Dinothrombium tinctorium]